MVRTRLNIGCRYSTPVRERPLHPTRAYFTPEPSQTQAPVTPATEPERRAGGSLTTNGYIESFNARLRDELLNGEIFYTLKEAQVLIESWRRHYNYSAIRPHSSLGYRPPAPETIVMPSWPPGSATLRRPPSLAEKPSMHWGLCAKVTNRP